MSQQELPISHAKVNKSFPATTTVEYDLKAFLLAVAFYGMYFALLSESISVSLFLIVAPVLFVRRLNAAHESFHTKASRLNFLHWLPIVTSPLQCGYARFRRSHMSHHVHNGDANDIEGYLSNGSAWKALFNAFTQSEQGLFYALRDRSMDKKLAAALVIHTAVFALMIQIGWGWGALYYIAATRIGNTFMWFMSSWVLHHPMSVDGFNPLFMPVPVRAVWWVVFGPDGLAGARHHELHHAYPSVPDSDLPKLSSWVQEVESQSIPQNVIVLNNLHDVQVAS